MSVLVIGRIRRVVDKAASALAAHGFDAAGVTTDEQAIAALKRGGVTAVVIGGGVEASSRQRLSALAQASGAAVINGHKGFRGIRSYIRRQIVPALRRSAAS